MVPHLTTCKIAILLIIKYKYIKYKIFNSRKT